MKKEPNIPKNSRGLEKNVNNRVTKEGDKDSLEDNADRNDKNNSYVHKEINEQENKI